MKRCGALVLFLLISCHYQAPSPALPSPARLATGVSAPTLTTIPTPLATPFPTPSPTPSITASPTLTPALPTGTPVPTVSQLADLSLCNQEFGTPAIARFSARLARVEVRQLAALDQLTFVFDAVKGQLHGSAGCLGRDIWEQAMLTTAAADTMIAINLNDWGHDQAFAASALTNTLPLTITAAFTGITFVPDRQASRGLTIGIGLHEALPYHIQIAADPDRLIVDVARSISASTTGDALGQPAGDLTPSDRPIFFLQNDDVWRWSRGQAAPVVKTDELETALAVSPDHDTLAICRAPAETDPSALPYTPRATLWLLRADGSEARELAAVGGCADLAFSPNGKMLAFTANAATMPPDKLSVWTVPLVVGRPVQAISAVDEWSRFAPQWLSDGRLIYRARNESGQTVIFIREADGREREVTARLLTGPRYSGVGEFLVNPNDNTLALEALRGDRPGADLVFLSLDGNEQAPSDGRGYWQRPLAWTDDGLIYLTTECPSAVIQRYTLRLRHGSNSADLVSGESMTGLGDVSLVNSQILYTRLAGPQGGNRGPTSHAAPNTAASVWLMTGDGKLRRQLYSAPVPVTALQGG